MQGFCGTQLAAKRRAAGLSRERLAIAVGRSMSSISLYEQGGHAPRAAVIGRLADVLGCDPGEFFADLPAEQVSA